MRLLSMKFASFLTLTFLAAHCKSVNSSSNPKALSDAISAPEEIAPGLYSVACNDGTTAYHSSADLGEEDGERVCRADRAIVTLQPTWLASENANIKGNCYIPANTTILLAAPLQRPTAATQAECTFTWNLDPVAIWSCRNFHASILESEKVKMLKGSSAGTEACHLSSGKLFGPMATLEDIAALKNSWQKPEARFIYIDRQLKFPRTASYPQYPNAQAQ